MKEPFEFKCRRCGGRIEATVPAYVHIEGDRVVIDQVLLGGDLDVDARWYCENDHPLDEADIEEIVGRFPAPVSEQERGHEQ